MVATACGRAAMIVSCRLVALSASEYGGFCHVRVRSGEASIGAQESDCWLHSRGVGICSWSAMGGISIMNRGFVLVGGVGLLFSANAVSHNTRGFWVCQLDRHPYPRGFLQSVAQGGELAAQSGRFILRRNAL